MSGPVTRSDDGPAVVSPHHGERVAPGVPAYLGTGHDELVMWGNHVGRSRAEVAESHRAWTPHDTDRFGEVRSPRPRIVTDPVPWRLDG